MQSNSILATAEKPKPRPPIITICGDAGVGKTTLAATFPNPIFIRAEDGMEAIPQDIMPDALPIITTVDQLWHQLRAIMFEEHNYKTLVIDSVTALERLFIQHVMDSDQRRPTSIVRALGGYGAGPKAVASMHQRVRRGAGILNMEKQMNIVFLAHADTEQFDPPDQDSYTRYCLRLAKGSMAPYVDDSDLVGFLKLKTYVKGAEDETRKKAISTGEIELVCYATAANISKNRYGITEDIAVPNGVNPLPPYIPAMSLEEDAAPAAKPSKQRATKNKTKTPAATEEAPQ